MQICVISWEGCSEGHDAHSGEGDTAFPQSGETGPVSPSSVPAQQASTLPSDMVLLECVLRGQRIAMPASKLAFGPAATNLLKGKEKGSKD